MALVIARDNTSGNEATVGEEWLARWPDDFTFIRYVDGDPAPPPAAAEAAPQQPAPAGGPADAGNPNLNRFAVQ